MTPIMLYRCPGKHRGPYASSYDYKSAKTEDEVKTLIEAGWAESLDVAMDEAGDKAYPELKKVARRKKKPVDVKKVEQPKKVVKSNPK
jgi:hypothetical protein